MSDQPGWSSPAGDDQGGTTPPPYGQPAYGQPAYGQPGSAGSPGYPAAPGYSPYGSYGYGQVPGTPKPGVIPLRPLGVGEILDGAFSTMRAHWKLMIGLAALVAAATSLIQLVANLSVLRNIGTDFGSFGSIDSTGTLDSSQIDTSGLLGAYAALAFSSLLQWIALTVLTGIFTVVVSQAVLGQPVTLSRTPSKMAARPPEFGEQTDEVLAEFGFDAKEIAELRQAKVV